MKKIKLLNIVGARPQIIKASAISRTIRNSYSDRIEDIIVHTGQHYDQNMSEVFFGEMEIDAPAYNLAAGSSSHAVQTARILEGCEEVINKVTPDGVIIYGDTNSTLAAALAATKMHLPVFHIEAGLRSFNKSMPEEINRIVADHLSTLLFAPTKTAIENLRKEGIIRANRPQYNCDNPGVFLSGDIMFDNALYFRDMAAVKKSGVLNSLGITPEEYILVTIHRDNNTDNSERLDSILNAVREIGKGEKHKVVMPLHPRTLKILKSDHRELLAQLKSDRGILIIEPVSYLEMIMLESNASLIVTDSGGVQKESHFFSKPCIVLRKETEWVELVENGTAILADADRDAIIEAFKTLSEKRRTLAYPSFYGKGDAASGIMKEIVAIF